MGTDSRGRLQFLALGPVEAWRDGKQVRLGGERQRALLAMLMLHANQLVRTEVLVEQLFSEQRTAGGVNAVRVAVSRLRRVLGDGDAGEVIETRPGGYLLRADPGQLDVALFERQLGEGQRLLNASNPMAASARLGEALASWRGPPLADLAGLEFAQSEIRRLGELRLLAVMERVDADLELGRHGELIAELETLVASDPVQERLRGQLMLALYRAGRQSDALGVYRQTSELLRDELGLEPSRALGELERLILRQDASLEPARAPASPASALPVAPTATIGREQDVDTVARLLDSRDVRLVTLTGPGGIGKTRLALEVAGVLESRFAGGVCWVELAGVARPEDVDSTVALALALTPLPGESMRDALRRYLAIKRLLLVLDNCEHVLSGARPVGELTGACPGLRVLATSREALNLAAEHRFLVAPLKLPQALTLAEIETTAATAMFLAAASRRDRRFAISEATAPLVAQICTRLDGLPLALELAAAGTGLLSVEQLAARFDRAPTDLGSGPRDAPVRQQTLDAAIGWSYRLLDEDLQRAFCRSAVFASGGTLDACQAVTGASLATLEALIDKSLLDRRQQADGSTRLVMLETVRQYALERLADDSVRQRHCEYFVQLAEQAVRKLSTHGENAALGALDREIDNIRAALQWALHTMPEPALRLAGTLGEYWAIRCDPEGLPWLDAALQTAGERAPLRDRARAQLARVAQLVMRHQEPEATDAASTALALYRQAADYAGTSGALSALAKRAMMRFEQDAQRVFAEKACQHARRSGDNRCLGQALAGLASALPAAEQTPVLEQAAAFLAQAGNYRDLANVYCNAAFTALSENRLGDAVCLLELALPAADKVNTPATSMFVLGNLGLARLFAGNLEHARDAFEHQLRLCAGNAFRYGADEGLAGLAAVSAREGRYEIAARLRGSARALGYPQPPDARIDDRLEREYFAPARNRYGSRAWRHAEKAGETLSYERAIAEALG